MDEGKSWEFKKGNTNELPTVSKSEKPINKENIGNSVLDFIYEKSQNDSELLKISEFNIEFLCWGTETAFIKIEITSGNQKQIDLKLTGKDAEKFVDLIKNTRFSDNDTDIKPNQN